MIDRYPMLHMLSLTFTPTALIGVNWQLDLPKDFKVNCGDADMSKFAYPKPLEEKKADKKVRVKVAELSTTAKAKAKSAKKKKEEQDNNGEMEVDAAGDDKNKKDESKVGVRHIHTYIHTYIQTNKQTNK
jgi:26S proteasome regulatory subunit N2